MSGLEILALAIGTGANQAAAGNHTHSQYGAPVLGNVAAALNPLAIGGVGTNSANTVRGQRVVIQQSGTLHDLAVLVTITSGGTLDLIIYNTASPRVRLWHSGAVAVPAVPSPNVWQIIGDPAMAVVIGEQY